MVDVLARVRLDCSVNRATHILGATAGKRSKAGNQSTGVTANSRGSMLVEMSLGLVILVLAVWLVAEVLGGIRQRRRNDAFIAELRNLSAVFQSQSEAALAAPSGDATLPPAIEELLKKTNWSKGSPFGGAYEWIPSDPSRPAAEGADAARRVYGAITVTAFSPSLPLTLSRADMRYIDAQLDDGNLATGRFRAGFNGWPHYLVGPEK